MGGFKKGQQIVSEQNWRRTEYSTWDEAFRGLAPVNRQQSVRVAEYSQVLFVGACAAGFGKNIPGGTDRMRGQYADLAYKCGLYHQLGKALVPPEYQVWRDSFTDEEKAVYRKYTTDGRLLVASLQERGARAREKRTGALIEQPTENIPWLMIRESCEQHMERYDGIGYPKGLSGSAISPIAQIVGLAKELDRLSAETALEHPFDAAIETLAAQSGTSWAPELIDVLLKNVDKCRDIYTKYIHYTMTLPETIPLVIKREDRPMGLTYRPMLAEADGPAAAYEAIPWFGGIADRPGETEGMEELEEMLLRTNLIADVVRYFLYEATDAALRLQNCKIDTSGILLRMPASFYKLGGQLQEINQLFRDQGIPKDKLMLTVPESVLVNATDTTLDHLTRYLRSGIVLVADGYHPDIVPVDRLTELGFWHVRFSPETYLDQRIADLMGQMRGAGLHILGGGADDHETLKWLFACGAELVSGQLTGPLSTEDDIIRTALTRGQ